jgi:tRNA 2-thiouridine synthesizing protein A
MTTETTATLDARGLNCPLPILRTKKALAALEPGDTLAVTSSDPGSVKDMDSFCQQTGNEMLSSSQDDEGFRFVIRKQ